MIKVTYIDGTTQEFEGHTWEFLGEESDVYIDIIKHQYDEDKEYDEDDDFVLASVNFSQVKIIERC